MDVVYCVGILTSWPSKCYHQVFHYLSAKKLFQYYEQPKINQDSVFYVFIYSYLSVDLSKWHKKRFQLSMNKTIQSFSTKEKKSENIVSINACY